MNFLRFQLLVVFILSATLASAQDEWRSWGSVQLKKEFTDKWSIRLKPILRHKEDLAAYDNFSIDVALAYKINSEFTISLLQRKWYIPDGGDNREFFFLQGDYTKKLSDKWILKNSLRWHSATDIYFKDVDFIRYIPKVSYVLDGKQQLFASLDFFYRLTDERTLSGARNIVGYNRKLGKGYSTTLQYWYQKGIGDLPTWTAHVLVYGISKTLKAKTKDN